MNTNGANYLTTLDSTANIEQWGKVLGLEHAIGNRDSYGYEHGQNMYGYKPSSMDQIKARWEFLLYDVELSMGTVTAAATNTSIFEWYATTDSVITNLWNTNAFRRAYWRGFWSLLNESNGPMRASRVLPVAAANYAALQSNQVTNNASLSGYTILTNWIKGRASFLTNQLASVRPAFQGLPTNAVTSQTTFDLNGNAPVEVVKVYTNGSETPVTWINQTQWVSTVGLAMGANVFKIEGYDASTNKLSPYGLETYTVTNTITRN